MCFKQWQSWQGMFTQTGSPPEPKAWFEVPMVASLPEEDLGDIPRACQYGGAHDAHQQNYLVCKDQLRLAGCQAHSEQAQRHHITCCLIAFCVLERQRCERNLRIYKLKRRLSLRGRSLVLPALERLKRAA